MCAKANALLLERGFSQVLEESLDYFWTYIEAGILIEPPPSKPMATGTHPRATATAEPDDDPPE